MNSSHSAAAQALSKYKQHLAELPLTKQRVKILSIRQLKERHGASGSLPLERGDHRFPSEWHQYQIWADTAAVAAYLAPLHPHLDMKCTTCECVHQEYIFAPSTAWSASITAVGIIRHRDLQTVAGICKKSDISCNCCCFGHKCFSRLKCCIKHGKLLGRCRCPYSFLSFGKMNLCTLAKNRSACRHTCNLFLFFQDLVNLLPVQGLVQGRCSLRVELEALTQLLQHSCLGGCCIQPATCHFLPQQPPVCTSMP